MWIWLRWVTPYKAGHSTTPAAGHSSGRLQFSYSPTLGLRGLAVDLPPDVEDLVVCELPLVVRSLCEVVLQIAPCRVVHHNRDGACSLNKVLVHPHNVGVPQILEQPDLSQGGRSHGAAAFDHEQLVVQLSLH